MIGLFGGKLLVGVSPIVIFHRKSFRTLGGGATSAKERNEGCLQVPQIF
jgi:hypothetical protein